MGMMSRLAAVVPEEAYPAVKYVVEQVLHAAAGGEGRPGQSAAIVSGELRRAWIGQ
jgi:hypothetical protein